MIIAVDFDDTIHDAKHPVPGRRMGPPVEGAREALTTITNNGHTIVIHTYWKPERHHVIAEWMAYYHIPYHEVTNVKPNADLFIDDKAVTFTTWAELMNGTF